MKTQLASQSLLLYCYGIIARVKSSSTPAWEPENAIVDLLFSVQVKVDEFSWYLLFLMILYYIEYKNSDDSMRYVLTKNEKTALSRYTIILRL